MIRKIIAAGQMAMSADDVATCQRVFYNACAAKGIKTRDARDVLASEIIQLHLGGIHVERDLLKIVAQMQNGSEETPIFCQTDPCSVLLV